MAFFKYRLEDDLQLRIAQEFICYTKFLIDMPLGAMAAAILTGEMAKRHRFDPVSQARLARVHLCPKIKLADWFHWAASAALRPLRVTGW